jgi:hypothetical protein
MQQLECQEKAKHMIARLRLQTDSILMAAILAEKTLYR